MVTNRGGLASSYWERGTFADRLALRRSLYPTRSSESLDLFSRLQSAQKILVAPSDRAGGLFLASSVYSSLRRSYPQADLRLLVHPGLGPLASLIPFFDELIECDLGLSLGAKETRSLCASLRKEQFDLTFCLGTDCSFRLAQICHYSGAGLCIGYARPFGPSFNIEMAVPSIARSEPDLYRVMLETIGLQEGEVWDWMLPQDTVSDSQVRAPSVGLDMGSDNSRFRPLRDLFGVIPLLEDRGLRPVIFFSLANGRAVNYLRKNFGDRLDYVDKGETLQAAHRLRHCTALVATNVDLLHAAIALKVPAVALVQGDETRFFDLSSPRIVCLKQTQGRELVPSVMGALEELKQRVEGAQCGDMVKER